LNAIKAEENAIKKEIQRHLKDHIEMSANDLVIDDFQVTKDVASTESQPHYHIDSSGTSVDLSYSNLNHHFMPHKSTANRKNQHLLNLISNHNRFSINHAGPRYDDGPKGSSAINHHSVHDENHLTNNNNNFMPNEIDIRVKIGPTVTVQCKNENLNY
jgi:hypothetical protein